MMIEELWHNVLNSTWRGFFGIAGIFTYMLLILGTAFYRIKKGDHMHH